MFELHHWWVLYKMCAYNFVSLIFTDSSSDDASIPEERITTPDREYNYPRDHLCNSRDKIKIPSQRDNSERRHQNNAVERRPQNLPPPVSGIFSVICFFVLRYSFVGKKSNCNNSNHFSYFPFRPCPIRQVLDHHRLYIEIIKIMHTSWPTYLISSNKICDHVSKLYILMKSFIACRIH